MITVFLRNLSQALNRSIICIGEGSAFASLAMVVLTLGVVILRYLFSTNVIPIQETVIYLHSVLIMTGIAYGLSTDAHVRGRDALPALTRRWISILVEPGLCRAVIPH